MTTLTRTAPGFAAASVIRGSLVMDGALAARPPRSDEELIAFTLITLWALATGRALPADVPPELLSEQELLDFWSDPLLDREEVR